nr:Chain C, Random peptide [unidentified]
NLLQKK